MMRRPMHTLVDFVFTLLATATVSHALPHGQHASDTAVIASTPSDRHPSPSFYPGAILSSGIDDNQRNAVFWTATIIAVIVSLVQGAITTLTDICESEGMWTVRFSLGRRNTNDSLGILLLSTASFLAVFRYALPAWRNRHYCSNRWAAWTGPSRTGIDPAHVPHIASSWQEMDLQAPILRAHPVDIRLPILKSNLILHDPTDILKALHAKSEKPFSQHPSSTTSSSAVHPTRPFKPALPSTSVDKIDPVNPSLPIEPAPTSSFQEMLGDTPSPSREDSIPSESEHYEVVEISETPKTATFARTPPLQASMHLSYPAKTRHFSGVQT
ncbi:hypothetical protein JAAARDRAFT_713101 [Jaapia argillacea MUCL 33604]|uniref:Uncharacterized protein n=1 Tax=Jaapia argillacea MUCL 33604 TaxID=933084 RepID=A0A067PGT6_9AGAM|nr:hypothetical protein JAAARDRAFT_713101 [Jaapia argillacea MUCL 33604]